MQRSRNELSKSILHFHHQSIFGMTRIPLYLDIVSCI
uniref:Uncharacterized protein n=1 Tax=Manihot esculenta TaxID=3983 RepID=A0A2C9VSW4_MANES